ncbi:phospholipase domain-containing protein [Streptomyces sp. L7]
MHGPNGFLRVFKGPGRTAGPEVTARDCGDDVELTFTNKGSGTVQLRVANGYGGKTQTVKVRAGATVRHTFRPRRQQAVVRPDGHLRRRRGLPAAIRRTCRERPPGGQRPGVRAGMTAAVDPVEFRGTRGSVPR